MFDAVSKRAILEKSGEPDPRKDVEELLNEMGRVLARSRRSKRAANESEKILEAVKVLVS